MESRDSGIFLPEVRSLKKVVLILTLGLLGLVWEFRGIAFYSAIVRTNGEANSQRKSISPVP
jgi:hypothetical protein